MLRQYLKLSRTASRPAIKAMSKQVTGQGQSLSTAVQIQAIAQQIAPRQRMVFRARPFSTKNDDPAETQEGEAAAERAPQVEVEEQIEIAQEPITESAPEVEAQATETPEAAPQEVKKSDAPVKKSQDKKPAASRVSPAVTAALIEDQQQQLVNQQYLSKLTASTLSTNLVKMQKELQNVLDKEKSAYLKHLNRQEELIKNDANTRIFAMVDETQAFQQMEKEYLASQASNENKTLEAEEQYNAEMQRKEIYAQYANSKPVHDFDQLTKLVLTFSSSGEKAKREIFTSLKMGQYKELAKLQLYNLSVDSSKQKSMLECQDRLAQYKQMLKAVIPDKFQEEYATLQQIKDKRENIDRVFTEAGEAQATKVQKMIEVQTGLRKHAKALLEANAQVVKNSLISQLDGEGARHQVQKTHEDFVKTQADIKEVQALLNEMPSLSSVGASDQPNESSLFAAAEGRTEAEVSAEQTRNLMLMVSKSKSDLSAKLSKEKKQIQERAKALVDPELGQEDVIEIKTSRRSNDSAEVGKSFLNTLNKYNVDPVWLQNQRSQRLTELLSQEYGHIGQKAAKIEDNLFLKEHDNLVAMINNKVGGKELHQYLLAQMSTASALSAGQNKDQALGQLVQERLRANFENRDFDQSRFIIERVSNAEAKKVLKAPTKTVFDPQPYQPRNAADQKEIEAPITYTKYKFNQLQALEALDGAAAAQSEQDSLLDRMSGAKRLAWLRIYNDFLDSRDAKVVKAQGSGVSIEKMNPSAHDAIVSDRDFYELFRGWQDKELDPTKSDHKYQMGLKVNSPPGILDQSEGAKVSNSLGTPFVRDPELQGNQNVHNLEAIEALRHHEALLTARQHAATKLKPDDIFAAGQDAEADLREAQRSAILGIEDALSEFLAGAKDYAIEQKATALAEAEAAGDQEAIAAAAALDPEQQTHSEVEAAVLADVQGTLTQAKAAFEEQFGENLYKQRVLVRVPGDPALDPAALELEQMGYPTTTGHQGGSYITRRNIARMDDTMIRRIEAHLAGTTLPSLEFGYDQEYLDAKHRSQNQVFDEAGFEAYKSEGRLGQMSKYGQQQELLYRMKTKEVQETLALQEREKVISEILESTKEPHDPEAERGRRRDDGASGGARLPGELARAARTKHRQLQNQIRAELNRLGRAGAKSGSVSAPGEALLAAGVEQEQQLVHEMESLFPQKMNKGGVLSEYINKSSNATQAGAQAAAAEEAVMVQLAQDFTPFDFDLITSGAKALAQEYLTSAPAGSGAAPNTGKQEAQNPQQASSLQIKEQALSKTQNPHAAKLGALYDPKNPIRESYLRAKYQMFVNEQIRASFATTILMATQRLQEVQAGRERFYQEAAGIASQYTSDIKSSKGFDLTEQAQRSDQTTAKALEILQRLDEFNPQSKEIKNFNDELRLHVSLLKAQKARGRTTAKAADQVKFVLNQMERNGVKADITTHSLLFKKNVLLERHEEATVNLHRVNQLSSIGRYSEIQGETLGHFFEQSLSRDNFNGLAHLATFTEKFEIDISGWQINKFRPALDFYLNHTPDLNKLLTFTRFYSQFVNGALRNESLEKADDAKRIEVFQKAFGSQLENLVDMNALFKHLVNAIGTKQYIDPVSKQDPVEQLINFYAQDDVQSICRLSEQGTTHINHSDIVKYISNHFDRNTSFAQLSKVMLKLDLGSQPSQQYTAEAIQALKGYQATHKRLPRSFSEENVRRLYIQTKELNMPISESTAEYLLFLFKSNGMAPESIDLCQNYHTMVKGYSSQDEAKLSDIRNYYLSDSLLAFPQPGEGKTYHELLQEGVFQDQRHGHAYLTAMTKAHFKDGSVDYALKFFQDGIAAQVKQKEDQEDYLVNLFNSTFGIDDSQNLTGDMDLASFREKYLQLVVVREKLKKETKAVHQLGQILDRCDPQEIEDVSSLHVVLREEKQLLDFFAKEVSHSDFQHLYELYDQTPPDKLEEAMGSFVSPALKDQLNHGQYKTFLRELQTVKARKEHLESKVQYQNRASLAGLMKTVGDDQVELLGNVSSIPEALQVLGLSEQEYQQMRASELENDHSSNGALYAVLKGTQDGPEAETARQKEVIRAFHRQYEESLSAAADKREARIHKFDDAGFGPDAPDMFAEFRSLYGYDVEGLYNTATLRPDSLSQEDADKLATYKRWQHGAPLTGADEPLRLAERALGQTVGGMENELTTTLEARRRLVLPTFLQQFNKVQSKNLSVPESLNLVRNESTYSKQEIKYMEKTSSKVQELLGSQESLRELLKQKGSGKGLAKLAKQVMGAEPDAAESQGAAAAGSSTGSQKRGGAGNASSSSVQEEPSLPDVRLLDPENIKLLKQAGLERGYDLKDPALISQTIDRFDMLLNDEHSPIISNFLHLLNYQDGGDMPSYDEYAQNWDQKRSEAAHLSKYLQEAEKMEALTGQVEAMHAGINSMERELHKKQAELQDNHENAGEAYQNVENRKRRIESLVEQKVYNLYNMFSRELAAEDGNTLKLDFSNDENQEFENDKAASQYQANAQSFYGRTLNREQKVQLMKQALSLEMGGFRSHSVFNSFYAQDLIFFGMDSDIPEAVRLGEHMLGELGQSLPTDVAKAVKKYRLNNNMKYNQAMKRTGPINTSSVYKTTRAPGTSGNYSTDSIVNLDDPYWQDYFARNYRAQDRYKLPSAMAWDHKEHGILGEMIDFKKVEENRKAFAEYM